jgi:hypothetical protein
MYTENDINWVITKPLSTAVIYTKDNTTLSPIPEYILNKKKNILKGDKVALVWNNMEPVITFPVRGNTLKSILTAIEKGMKEPISVNDNAANVYSVIGRFFGKSTRMELVKKFESGKLKPSDIIGDHHFYSGNLSRKNHIWMYSTES